MRSYDLLLIFKAFANLLIADSSATTSTLVDDSDMTLYVLWDLGGVDNKVTRLGR